MTTKTSTESVQVSERLVIPTIVEQPASSTIQPWISFPELSYDFINDGFVHDSKAVLKVNLSGTKGGVSVKQTVSESKTGSYITDETGFWFNLPKGRSFFAKTKTGENLKLHYDNGTSTIFNKPINFYAALSMRRQVNHLSWRLGFYHNESGLNTDNRIKIQKNDKLDLTFSTRTLYLKNGYTWGFLAACDLSKKILTKNSLLFGYDIDDKTSFFVRAENENFRKGNIQSWKNVFDHFVVDTISKYNKTTKFGVECSLQPSGRIFQHAQVVVQKQLKEDITTKIKLKLCSRWQLNALLRFPVPFDKQNGEISLGLHGVNLHNKNRDIKWGSQIQFNL